MSVHGGRYVHKVGLVLELYNGLEDQSPASHPQQAAGVLCVGEHSACGGETTAVKRRKHREGTSGGKRAVAWNRGFVVRGSGSLTQFCVALWMNENGMRLRVQS